LFLHTR